PPSSTLPLPFPPPPPSPSPNPRRRRPQPLPRSHHPLRHGPTTRQHPHPPNARQLAAGPLLLAGQPAHTGTVRALPGAALAVAAAGGPGDAPSRPGRLVARRV